METENQKKTAASDRKSRTVRKKAASEKQAEPKQSLVDQILDEKTIEKALGVMKKQKAPYWLLPEQFEHLKADYEASRQDIAQAIRQKRWTPKPAVRVEVLKKDGGMRTIMVLQPMDRLIQEALRIVLFRYLKPRFSRSVYHYDNFRGVRRAHQQCCRLLRQGNPWAVKADVRNCGESLSKETALACAAREIPDETVLALIEAIMYATDQEIYDPANEIDGLYASTELTSLFIDMALMDLDRRLDALEIPFVRFGDDWMIFCKSREQARERLDLVRFWLHEQRGLQLHPLKTCIQHLKYGPFLGADLFYRPKKNRVYVTYESRAAATSKIERSEQKEKAAAEKRIANKRTANKQAEELTVPSAPKNGSFARRRKASRKKTNRRNKKGIQIDPEEFLEAVPAVGKERRKRKPKKKNQSLQQD